MCNEITKRHVPVACSDTERNTLHKIKQAKQACACLGTVLVLFRLISLLITGRAVRLAAPFMGHMALGSRHQEVLISETLLTTSKKERGSSAIPTVGHIVTFDLIGFHGSWCCTVGYNTITALLVLLTQVTACRLPGSPHLYILTTCLEKFRKPWMCPLHPWRRIPGPVRDV